MAIMKPRMERVSTPATWEGARAVTVAATMATSSTTTAGTLMARPSNPGSATLVAA